MRRRNGQKKWPERIQAIYWGVLSRDLLVPSIALSGLEPCNEVLSAVCHLPTDVGLHRASAFNAVKVSQVAGGNDVAEMGAHVLAGKQLGQRRKGCSQVDSGHFSSSLLF